MARASEHALDRARVYRGLARLFEPPGPAVLAALAGRDGSELAGALARLAPGSDLEAAGRELAAGLAAADAARLRAAYTATFEVTGGLRCPPHETSLLADEPGRALTRTFDLADVAGFYRAFGVAMAEGGERCDHVAAECEFMQLLAAKEAVAGAEPAGAEHVALCRDAARAFLVDHLGRFAGRLAARLEEGAGDPLYAAAGRLLRDFVDWDAARLDAAADRPGAPGDS
jgi:TorA maturation chaperone TorD